MLIYRGKLNWFNYAINEAFTIILPGPELKVGSPAIASWQWTKNSEGKEKSPVFANAPIDAVIITETGQNRILFHQSNYYRFEGTFSPDLKTFTVVMKNPNGDSSQPLVLNNKFHHPTSPNTKPMYFFGKFNWYNYAVNEDYLLVFPEGTGLADDALAFWQWTEDSSGTKKGNVDYVDRIRSVGDGVDGKHIGYGSSEKHYYAFDGTLVSSGKNFNMTMKNPKGDKAGPFNLTLQG